MIEINSAVKKDLIKVAEECERVARQTRRVLEPGNESNNLENLYIWEGDLLEALYAMDRVFAGHRKTERVAAFRKLTYTIENGQ